jgi:hypothetical protein
MFFWIGLVVALVLAGVVTWWGIRGFDKRVHKPGSQRLR